MTAAVLTTGCRLNQAESDALAGCLRRRGIAVVADAGEADVCYVNTCSVTTEADRGSLRSLRRALSRSRLRPRPPHVVALGCLAEAEPDRLRALPGVAEVWDNERKQEEIADATPLPRRSRPMLKVQDGCDAGCTFCRASRLRGRPRSVPAARVRQQVEALLGAGFAEVVLSGLNLGRYEGGLAALLEALLAIPRSFRVRLASLEPSALGDNLFAVLADPRVCAHFHVSLQSGDDTMLRRMGRHYHTDWFAHAARRLKELRPEANLGADVIVGFPGEDAESFGRTRQFLESVPLDYLHVFPYSPRPGTPAFGLGDPVARDEKRERVRELRRFAETRRQRFERRFTGTVRQVVVESGRTALTDNYIRLRTPGGSAAGTGGFTEMFIERDETGCIGRAIGDRSGRVQVS